MQRTIVVTLFGLVALGGFSACGESSSSDSSDGDGDGGTSGTAPGGASGTGGSSGTSGASTGGKSAGGSSGTGSGTGGTSGASAGGSAGTAPSGGSAGTVPLGGTGGTGTGGTSSSGAECETNDDCVMFADCCSCTAIPKGTNFPSCDRVCVTDHCTSQTIGLDEAACINGRCIINRSCDANRITCPADPVACPEGLVHSVSQDGCYGPCLPPTDCRDVTNCTLCEDSVCVSNDAAFTESCVVPPDGCTKGNYCQCLGACSPSFLLCTETDDGVACSCLSC